MATASIDTSEDRSATRPRSAAEEHRDLRRLFVALICVLAAVGVQMVYSASVSSAPTEREQVFLSKHLVFLAIAALSGLAVSRIHERTWYRITPWLFAVFCCLLVTVLIPGIGVRVNGAQRWLRFGSLSFQPSELGRIVLPLLAARMLIDRSDRLLHPVRGTIPFVLPLLIVAPLLLKQPDLGSTAFLTIAFGTALFIGGWPLRYFVGLILLVVPAAASLLVLKPYQMQRIVGFMNTWRDLNQAPWQIRQSLFSLGSGGLNGSGVGRGWQKLSYLPESNTDFVFAVIGEEFGLLGTLTIVILWVGVLLVGRSLFRRSTSQSFATTVGLTLLVQLVLQAMLNIAVVTAMVPPKGVPHPFVSYGGTNLVVCVMTVGMIVGLSKAQDNDDFATHD